MGDEQRFHGFLNAFDGTEAEEARAEDPRCDRTDLGKTIVSDGDIVIECITIIGQIEGHYALGGGQKSTKYEHLIPQLVSCEENKNIDGLLLILNTIGGDVEAGLAIAELIASMKKKTVSLVLGGGHSIGIPLAVSAEQSFIVPSATMTLHPVRLNGMVIGVSQSFEYFKKMQARVNDFICRHCDIEAAELQKLLYDTDELISDIGSLIDGETAVKIGLIDRVGGLSDAIAALKESIRRAREADRCT